MTTRVNGPLLAALLVAAGGWHPLSAQDVPPAKPPTAPQAAPATPAAKSVPKAKAKGKSAANPPQTKGKLKPVDINNATKEELSFMLGIDVGLAAKIVAGRPYLTKARLVTNNIVSQATYETIKGRIVANQGKPAPAKAAPAAPVKPVK